MVDTGYLKPGQVTYTARNLITFKIDEFANQALANPFDVEVQFKVYYRRANGASWVWDSTGLVSLRVTYTPTTGTYTHKAIHTFLGGYEAELKIFQVIVHNGTLSEFEDVLLLENEILVNREYQFDCVENAITEVSHSDAYVASKGELRISWAPETSADEYDLEWTWVDQSAENNYKTAGEWDSKKIFTRNATRVTITAEEYFTPLLYDGEGYLFYRVRAVQVKPNGQRIESNWSSDYESGLGMYEFSGHENDLNWQASTSFAEEGKRKSVLQYFDGTLRNRQTVTKDNTTDTTIVAETLYDFQGRPVIQVLPSRSLSSLIGFTPNFNRAVSGGEYEKDLYDGTWEDSCYCTAGAPPMDSLYGASKYYSPANQLVNTGYHKYIPDAEKYPFTEIRYTADNTGRLSMQSGVGRAFQIGMEDNGYTHATRYYYGSADQEELDALFGTEVGKASHYFKNMVRDANGQYSIAYIDMHGRTIATALAGKPNASLDTLESNKTQLIVKKLLDSNNNIIKNTTIESSKSLIVTKAGNHRFQYSLLPDSINLKDCNNIGICYDCVYDLEITITDECNNTSLPGDTPYVFKTTNLTIDTTCNEKVPFPAVDFSVFLEEGAYLITKKLTVNKDALEYYRDSIFMRRNTCTTLEQFIQQEKDSLLHSMLCEPTCEECNMLIDSYEGFVEYYMEQMGIPEGERDKYVDAADRAYREAYAHCELVCYEGTPGDHVTIREQMLDDVSPPFGQYADPDRFALYSIFWRNRYTQVPYTDIEGNPILVQVPGRSAPVSPGALTKQEFIDNYDPAWAEFLLPLHPEYCRLEKLTELSESNNWDSYVGSIDTYEQAYSEGNLAIGYLPSDPINSVLPNEYLDDLLDSLRHMRYGPNPQDTINIWSLATIMAHCPEGDGACFENYKSIGQAFNISDSCVGVKDMVWRFFRSLYQQKKREVVHRWMNEYCPAPLLDQNEFHVYFPDPAQPPAEMANSESIGIDSLNKLIADNCASYVQLWWEELKPCNYSDADTAVIFPLLREVCREGGDIDHVFGASTVRPSSSSTVRSFEQVLQEYDPERYNAGCNVYLISAPRPYEVQSYSIYSDKILLQSPDSCECATIDTWYMQYLQNRTGNATFADYLYQVTGTRMYDGVLDTLRMACNGQLDCRFLSEPLVLPPFLQCGGDAACVECDQVDSLYQQFRAAFPGVIPAIDESDSVQQVKNRLFEKYMNTHLGFGKQAWEYLQFMEDCGLEIDTVEATYCDTLMQWIDDFHDWQNSRWRVNFGGTFSHTVGVPLTEIFKHGRAKLPDYYVDTLTPPSNHVNFDYIDTLCFDATGFDVEWRLRLPDSLVMPNDYGDTWWLWLGGDSTSAGSILVSLGYVEGAGAGVCLHQDDSQKQCVDENVPAISFNNWRLIRLRLRGTDFKVYADTTLVAQRTIDAPFTQIRRYLSANAFSLHGEIDFVRIRDTAGNIIWEEQFNDALNIAKPVDSIRCTGCEERFTQYFNQRAGTSYSYAQIDSIYNASCNINVHPCSNFSANYLERVRDEFENLYYNFGRRYDANGCDTMTWRVNYGNTYQGFPVQYKDVFHDGVMQYPHSLGVGSGKNRIDYDFIWRNSACVERHFSVEIRLRQEAMRRMFMELFFNPRSERAKKYYIVYDSASLFWNYIAYYDESNHDNDRTYFSVSEFMQDFTDWKVIKYEFQDSLVHYYIDGQYLRTFVFQYVVQPEKWYTLGIGSEANGTRSVEIDYIRAYDKNGNLFYNENFDDCQNRSVFADYIRCPKQPCDVAFTSYFNNTLGTSHTYEQIRDLYEAHGMSLLTCDTIKRALTLCGKSEPVFGTADPEQHTPCADSTLFSVSVGTLRYEAYRDSLLNSFTDRYLQKCLNARYHESFTVEQPASEYHYTLYYYDQAGNLVKTVPPAGVDMSKFNDLADWSDQVAAARNNRELLTPNHTLTTHYRYNTLNQVVAQQSPDGGLSEFWYDRLGRLAVSRNAKQKAAGSSNDQGRQYSYTLYDHLGRITEVGQLTNTSVNGPMTDLVSRNATSLATWLSNISSSKEQVTRTIYDLPYEGFIGVPDIRLVVQQRNLRNRVSYVSYTDGSHATNYNNATFYTYDILGNVDTLLQDYGRPDGVPNIMNMNGNRFKKIVYQYDLISGKVNMVMYQPGWGDRFYHRYSYDAENRLTLVETSFDSLVWERDARYEYYRHGPLARMVIGEQMVQGLDYAYTLQGWLKGINSTGGTRSHDMGSDGQAGSLNQYTARDVLSMSLNYFEGDYKAINGSVDPFPAYSNQLGQAYRPLYNGNISSATLLNRKFDTESDTKFYNYRYDQLNRFTGMDLYTGYDINSNSWATLTHSANMQERVSYDANGNILRYRRNAWPTTMDSLTYSYYPGTNRLRRIRDSVPGNLFGSNGWELILDIDDQSSENNYVYDAIGNLVSDEAEQISNITWSVYGKIRELNRTATPQVDVSNAQYTYDAMGNLVGRVYNFQSTNRYVWYVRDAQGNLLTTYAADGNGSLESQTLYQTDRYIYGSSRVGMYSYGSNVDGGPADMQYYSTQHFERGWRHYELSNHLGNVLVTLSDRKFGVSSGGSLIDYYEPDMLSGNDYYPFGMLSRVATSYTGTHYRYGFNGKEHDSEAKGWQNQVDYGMRVYDPRIGKFLSIDPKSKKFPHFSPYQYAGNTPIQAVDLDGGEPIRPKTLVYNKKDLGFLDRTLSSNSWSYYVYIPAETSDDNPTLVKVANSYGVQWQVNNFWGESSNTYIHTDDLVWVEYKGTFYNMTDLANQNISEKDFLERQTWEEYWSSVQTTQESLNSISERTALAASAGQLVGGLAAAAKAIRISRIYQANVKEKLTKYLLDPNHPVGGSKAKWFKEALGFTKDNWKDLAKQIVFDINKAVSKGNTKGFGEKFEQIIEIMGANGEKIAVQFNFIVREGEDFARLVGAIPTKR